MNLRALAFLIATLADPYRAPDCGKLAEKCRRLDAASNPASRRCIAEYEARCGKWWSEIPIYNPNPKG